MIVLNEKGAALILVLLMTAVIIAVTLEVNMSARSSVYEAANFRDRTKARYVAKSGYNTAAFLLSRNNNNFVSLHQFWAKPELLTAYSAKFFEDGSRCFLAIEDEYGKLPVHKLTQTGYREIFRRFLKLPEFNLTDIQVETILDSLKDWIDSDDDVTGHGAESSYYNSLSPPSEIKNGPPDSIEELLLVKGITPEIFFGSENQPGIEKFITVYGEGKININTASKQVLQAVFDITSSEADFIDDYRQKHPDELSNKEWLNRTLTTATSHKYDFLTITSDYFRIISTGTVYTIKENVTAVVEMHSGTSKVLFERTGI
jgi:general secretion pathway protein K